MKCLLCGRNTNTLLTDTLRGGLKGKVYFCKSCELGFLENFQSKEEVTDYYKDKYRKDSLHKVSSNPQELFNLYVNFQEDRIKLIEKYLSKNTELLEVGCSVGMFLYNVRKYTNKIIGVDYDIDSGKFAADKCKCLVYDKDIKKTGLPKKSFDIICMFQILEHAKDPIKLISQYKEYLKPNGYICIEVPNIYDALRYAYDLPNHSRFYFHNAHLWYFSEKSMELLMHRLGFSGHVEFSQSYNVLNHFHWIDTDMPQKSCISGLSAPSFSFKNDLNKGIAEKLNEFILTADFYYKDLLKNLKIADNLIYIGRKNG